MKQLAFALRLLARDWRAGEMRVLAAALVIATGGGAAAEPVAFTGATVHTVAQGTLENATVVFDGELSVNAVGSGITFGATA